MAKIIAYISLGILFLISGYTGEFLARFKFIKSFKPVFFVLTIAFVCVLFFVHLDRWYDYSIVVFAWLFISFFMKAGFSTKRDPTIDKKKGKKIAEDLGKIIGDDIADSAGDVVEDAVEWFNR